ncbi:MAG: TonB-dependent receptor plug domain-containing protein [Prevotella sp.]|jgi:hypothetical protein|nr:TonB-dependent receptor plug domain-containing protein [Prevotella sp.]MCI1324813.1 TonB-dependent receptor plug domain-containing protein [Prevotella sp.]MCI1349134.1 TonB-dependent receptor plug domain-containing protein [Prevotella sp.]MCI1415247.1 TonB-dependent receptor plug domain-containing protein [Prevotella sp.]MCI1449894.1 TonB-dependent receptor plug domain-containing protein [Prevotella sp.]
MNIKRLALTSYCVLLVGVPHMLYAQKEKSVIDSIGKVKIKNNKQYAKEVVISEVVVSSKKKDNNVTGTVVGLQSLTGNEIKKIPALMGEVDVIKAIQLLPGVQVPSEGSCGFNVQGGTMDQNLILLDNVNVYNASHMFGFFSVFNNDAVESADLYKGDLPIKYGGRLSSLLDVKLKDDSPEKITGTGGLGLISSRLTVEGPLGKNTSWLVSARRSYADVFLRMSSDPEKKNEYLYFYDIDAKMSHRFSLKDKFYLNIYNGYDRFIAPFGKIGYGNSLISGCWNHLFSDNLFSKLSLNYSRYKYDLVWTVTGAKVDWMSDIQDLELRWDLSYMLSEKLRMTYGTSSVFHSLNPALIKRPGYPDFRMQRSYALEHNVYIGLEQTVNRHLSLNYGARFTAFRNIGKGIVYNYDQNYQATGFHVYGNGKIYHTYIRPELRASAVYLLDEKSSLKACFSHNVQFLQMANNSDSGSPFDLWFPASPNIKPQEADLYSLGYFRNFHHNAIETSAEVYYKKMRNVIDFKDNAQLLFNEKLDGEVRTGTGKSCGVELMVKKNTGRLTGFVNYTLARTVRTIPGINNGKTYLAPSDKTHSVNVLASYQLNKKWDFSAEWVFATGAPVTYPTGRFEINGEYYPIYSGRNNDRRKPYHRLDVSATYHPHPKSKKWSHGEWVFSVYNIYWHKNPWMTYFDQDTDDGFPHAKMIYLFGAVPSITYNFNF